MLTMNRIARPQAARTAASATSSTTSVRALRHHYPALRRTAHAIAQTLRSGVDRGELAVLTNARELLDLAPRCGGGVLGIWWATPREAVCRLAGRSLRIVTVVCATSTGAAQLAAALRRRGNVGIQVLGGQLRLLVDGQAVTGYAVLAPISPDRERAEGWWQAPPLATQSGYLAEKERRARHADASWDERAAQADARQAFVGEAEPDYLFQERDRAQEWDAIYERRADTPSEISDAAEPDLAAVEALANLKFVAETDFDTPFAYLDWRQRCQTAKRAGEPAPSIRPPRPRDPAQAAAFENRRRARREAQAQARQALRDQASSLEAIAAEVCGTTSPASDLLEQARRRDAALWAGWDEPRDAEDALIVAGRQARREAQARAVATAAALESNDAAHALQEA
jgi:hypothetical protein